MFSRTTMGVLHLCTSFQRLSRAVYRKSHKQAKINSKKKNSRRSTDFAIGFTTLSSKDCGLCVQKKNQTKYRVSTTWTKKPYKSTLN